MTTLIRKNLSERLDLNAHPDVETLVVSESDIGLIVGFESAKNLKSIVFRECGLTAVPDLSTVKKLRKLDLGMNYDLKSFDKLVGLKLNELAMEGCDLKEIPAELGGIKGLKTLNLADNFTLKSFDHLGGLSETNKLVLRRCKLSEVPATLGRMEKLKVLDISRNSALTTLEGAASQTLEKLEAKESSKFVNIGNLNTPNLTSLNLSLSALSEIEPDIVQLESLHKFDLSYCVNLTSKSIEKVVELPNLVHLDLRGTKIKKLPKTFANFPALKTIALFDDVRNTEILSDAITIKWSRP